MVPALVRQSLTRYGKPLAIVLGGGPGARRGPPPQAGTLSRSGASASTPPRRRQQQTRPRRGTATVRPCLGVTIRMLSHPGYAHSPRAALQPRRGGCPPDVAGGEIPRRPGRSRPRRIEVFSRPPRNRLTKLRISERFGGRFVQERRWGAASQLATRNQTRSAEKPTPAAGPGRAQWRRPPSVRWRLRHARTRRRRRSTSGTWPGGAQQVSLRPPNPIALPLDAHLVPSFRRNLSHRRSPPATELLFQLEGPPYSGHGFWIGPGGIF